MRINFSTILIVVVLAWYGWLLTGGTSPVLPLPKPKNLDSEAALTLQSSSASYRSAMADLYLKIAGEVESGEINTVEEFAKATYSRNKELRLAEREQLERLMEKRLGEESLDKPAAAAFLRELAEAYEEVQP